MFDQWDDDKLNELEDRKLRGVDAQRDKTRTHAEALKLQQAVDPDILAMVRDLFLAGKDIDAIGILANELQMVPAAAAGRSGPDTRARTLLNALEVSFVHRQRLADMKPGPARDQQLRTCASAAQDVLVEYAKIRAWAQQP